MEVLVSALPVTAIVYILALTPLIDLSGTELLTFTVGAVLLVLGIGLFNLGADLAMTPMGSHVGAGLSRQKKLWLLLGFRGIIAERRAMKRILDADDQQIINFM